MMAKLLTPQDLFDRWERLIPLRTIQNWRWNDTGKGPPFVRFGGRVFYPLDRVEEWERQRLVRATSDYGSARG